MTSGSHVGKCGSRSSRFSVPAPSCTVDIAVEVKAQNLTTKLLGTGSLQSGGAAYAVSTDGTVVVGLALTFAARAPATLLAAIVEPSPAPSITA